MTAATSPPQNAASPTATISNVVGGTQGDYRKNSICWAVMSSLFTVRPSNSEKTPFRINLTAVSLLSLKVRPGDLCTLCLPGESESGRVAIVWENSSSGMKDTVVQTSKFLQELYGFKLGDRVTLHRSPDKLQDASRVILRSQSSSSSLLSDKEKADWAAFASATVRHKYDVLAPSQKLVIEVGLEKGDFEVVDVGGLLGRITQDTVFAFESDAPQEQVAPSLDFATIGGLASQAQAIREFVEACFDTEISQRWPGYRPDRGLLLYGAMGTGKSLVLNAVADSGWANVVKWTPGVEVKSIQGPQLVTIEFDEISMSEKTTSEVQSIFTSLRGSSTLVVACVRHPNDIADRLRKEGCFSVELELPVPDADQRLDILRVQRGNVTEPDDTKLRALAARTHGFVGSDLYKLMKRIWYSGSKRHKVEFTGSLSEKQPIEDEAVPYIIDADIEHAMQSIRPSALQEIFLEKPNVRWSDIGGQHDLKQRLQDAIELPLKYPDRMKRFNLNPAKGVLLYGPPGCSKTLTVKALATEADYNFLVVKGAELISKYVGDSEKATREIFRKARQASPSIIFFDEFDAIASRGKSGGDLHVLTTLLNEMDGFEELRNVMVVAATNKPESIDPALMRPGRFDSVVYIGPPDLNTRKDIFDKNFAKSSVSEEVREQSLHFAQQTEGFSGAEIVAVCQTAGWLAFKTGQDSITPDQILQAISQTPKGITSEMLRSYEEWNMKRMR